MPSLPEAGPGEGGAVRLAANASTVTAADLRRRLVAEIDGPPGDVLVDAAEVASVGQAVLQLLVAARAEAASAGRTLRFVKASPAFLNRVAGCRLGGALGLEQAA
ncbi:STAS domain-containing protein [Sphingomonas quercus]|uniref:STAS domain-containing protein n=1 Tax=Sphingomonas quercus TaxID=2842451 RepID=A0ABS6BK15_9SPHN|nr:STAS domain-containing protein [Sphingomonas quercus]MBU3078643.1 STAS domain-containing protein [Sphingomonas quercus]